MQQSRNASRKAPSQKTLSRSYHATRPLSEAPRPAAVQTHKLNRKDGAKADGNKTILSGIAAKLMERAPLMVEPYVAYGATQQLVKECIRPGDYTIPQALEKNAEIPRDETGAHVGVGTGWWYDSKEHIAHINGRRC